MMLSKINQSATRAIVFLADAADAPVAAVVTRRQGKWQATAGNGDRLFAVPHTLMRRKKHPVTGKEYGAPIAQEVPLGIILNVLRRKLLGAPNAPQTPAS